MQHSRRKFLRQSKALALLLGVGSLPNLAFGEDKLTLWGAPALISLPLAVAYKQGNAQKIKSFDFNLWKSPDILRAGFASKDFKISAAPSNVGITLAHQGLDVKLLNILTRGLNYLFTKDEDIKSFDDLRGKKLIVPFKNDLPDLIFQILCQKLGVNISQINIHYAANPPQATQLFITGEFDAVLSQEPLASALGLLASKNGVKVFRQIDIQKLWQEQFNTSIAQAGLIVENAFYQQNEAFVNTLQQVLEQALVWINDNKDSAADFGAKYLPAPVPAIKIALDYANLSATRALAMSDELLKFYKILYDFNPKFLGGKMPDKSLFL